MCLFLCIGRAEVTSGQRKGCKPGFTSSVVPDGHGGRLPLIESQGDYDNVSNRLSKTGGKRGKKGERVIHSLSYTPPAKKDKSRKGK